MQKQKTSVKNSKDAIVSVALRVFGRHGVYKTTMSDIARASKKGRRTIYQYFKSKEEVYEAVLEKETSNMVTTMRSVVELDIDTDVKLRSYAHERIKSIYGIADNHHAFKIGFIHNDKVILNIRKRFDKIDTELLSEIMKEGKESGQFKVDDVRLAVKNIQIALRGMEIDFIKKNFDDSCKRQLNQFMDMLFQGIKRID